MLGLMFSAMAVAIAIGEICWGWTADRAGPQVPIVAGTLGLGLVTGTFLVAQTVPMFFLAFVLSGLFRPIMPVVSRWYMGTHAPARFRASAMALITAVMWGTQSIAGFAGGFVAEGWGQTAVVSLAAVLAVLPGLALLASMRQLRFRSPTFTGDVERAESTRPSHPTGNMISYTLLLGAVAATFFFCFATISTFLPLFATEVIGTSPGQVGVLFGMRGLVQFLAVLPFARLADRNGKRIFIIAGLLGVAISMAGVGLSKDFSWLAVSIVLLALSSAAYLPAASALLSEGVPLHRQGTAMGLYGFLEDVGLIVGPAVGGYLWSASGPQAPFYLGGLAAASGVLLFLSLLRGKARQGRDL